MRRKPHYSRPNVLFLMTDQQRFDTIAALGNSDIYTPNIDRLVARGAAFTNAYSTCPVCVPARYTINTGCESPTTNLWQNWSDESDLHRLIRQRCGPYLPEVMSSLGYRTFGVGKFHTIPWDASLGFETQLHSEEEYGSTDQRSRDAYAAFIAKEHPEYAWIEQLMGERTEMYYIPQMSPLPAELTVESWAADRAVELIRTGDDRPWFGFVSFIGPHPPFAPPIPYNRMYDPDRMSAPIRGDIAVDHMDQYIPLMNHLVWAENIDDGLARKLKSRYYGEITYIDQCIGKILDEIARQPDADNTVICFFSDHGEHLGDHHAWQKESFFEESTKIPFLLSWPGHVSVEIRTELVSLADLFGVATSAAGKAEFRAGADLLGTLAGHTPMRDTLLGYHGQPGTRQFKIMIRRGRWKLIYFTNGGTTQLYDLADDPRELDEVSSNYPDQVASMLEEAYDVLLRTNCHNAIDGGTIASLPFHSWQEPLYEHPLKALYTKDRILQFDASSQIYDFPSHPSRLL